MKYIVVTKEKDGSQTKRIVEATSLSQSDTFVTFSSKNKVLMISSNTIVSICTQGFEPIEIVEKKQTRKEHNQKVIQLYGLKK